MKKLEFFEMVDNKDFEYFYFERITKRKTVNGVPFFRYVLENNLTPEKKEYYLKKYNNIIFERVSYRWSPQQLYDVLIVFDKVIK